MREKLFKLKLKRIKVRGERYKREYEAKKKYSQYVPERKKRKVSNILLVVVVVAIVSYTVANLWITYATGMSVDSTLTTCFYAFFSSELFLLAGIKLSKIKNRQDDVSYNEINSVLEKLESEENNG